MAGIAGAVILKASLLFDAAARPQRAARLVVRAEAEAAAAPKAAPKKEVGPKRGSQVRAAAAPDPKADRQLSKKQDRYCRLIKGSWTNRTSSTVQQILFLRSWTSRSAAGSASSKPKSSSVTDQ
jgi:hypothetical protein